MSFLSLSKFNLSRRNFMAGAGASLTVPHIARAGSALPFYKDILPTRLSFSSVYGARTAQSPRALQLLRDHCDVVVPEFVLKSNGIFPGGDRHCKVDGRLTMHWPDVTKTVAFAKRNGKLVHAHAFFFPKHPLPSCVVQNGRVRPDFLKQFAAQVAGMPFCDCFNEVLLKLGDEAKPYNNVTFEEGQTDAEAEADLAKVLHRGIPGETGDEQLSFLANLVKDFELFFKDSENSKPHLLLNEDELSNPGKHWAAKKRSAVLRLLKALEDRGACLKGVGMQSHLSASREQQPDIEVSQTFVRTLGQRNYDVHISELDVKTSSLPQDESFSDYDQAELVLSFTRALLPEQNVKRVGVWGLADR